MSDSGVREVYVYNGMRLVPETRLLLSAEKLAAAEAALEKSRKTIYISTWDFIEHAEMLSIHSDIEGKNLSEVMSFLLNERIEQKTALAAAEARIRGLEETLRNAVEMIHDANGPLEYAKANDWMRGQLLALQPPPPEAEKRGEG